MSEISKRVDQWLRDAHAMEEQAETILGGQTGRLEYYPELKARMEAHLEETKSQRERLERCLESRGVSSSSMKDMSGQVAATMQNLGGVFAGDEVVKGVLASYSFEHMEIASYRILAAAAEADADSETARVCREICDEEEAMAAWLKDNMAEIATVYLHRDADEKEDQNEAKR